MSKLYTRPCDACLREAVHARTRAGKWLPRQWCDACKALMRRRWRPTPKKGIQ